MAQIRKHGKIAIDGGIVTLFLYFPYLSALGGNTERSLL